MTPVAKGDFDPMATSSGIAPVIAWPSLDGDKVLYQAQSADGSAQNNWAGYTFVAGRTADGWSSSLIDKPEAGDQYSFLSAAVAPDLSKIVAWQTQGNQISPFGVVPWSILAGPAGGPYDTLLTLPPGFHGGEAPVGASDDLSHVVIQATNPSAIDPAATDVRAGHVLYESVGGTVRRIDVKDDGTSVSDCGAVLASGGAISYSGPNAVSDDGSRIFFMSPDPDAASNDPTCGTPRLYMRENGTATTEVSVSIRATPDTPQLVRFSGASADGSKVLMTTSEQLTDDASGNSPELYLYDVAAQSLTRVTRGDSGTADGDVKWATMSDDGSRVYIVTTGDMVAGAGTPGQPKLYRYDTSDGSYHFIGTLSSTDIDVATNFTLFDYPNVSRPWYTTPDGGDLLFSSNEGLTGDATVGGPQELYRYDDASGDLDCVSCPPAGTPQLGNASFVDTSHSIPLRLNRYIRPMTDDGETVFFDTPSQIAAADGNDKRDVYEWRAGNVTMISSGTSPNDAFFSGASTDGRDVFFSTHARLVPGDRDDLGDLYDARVGGGFPVSQPAPQCSDDACQGAPPAAGDPLTPASATTFGLGNLVPGPEPVLKGRSFSVRSISAAQRRAFARRGRLTLTVTTSDAGTIDATAKARIGRKARGVAHAARVLHRAGTAHITLLLSSRARQALARQRRLTVSLDVTFTGVARAKTAHLILKRSK